MITDQIIKNLAEANRASLLARRAYEALDKIYRAEDANYPVDAKEEADLEQEFYDQTHKIIKHAFTALHIMENEHDENPELQEFMVWLTTHLGEAFE